MTNYVLMVIALLGPVVSAFGASAMTNHRLARLEQKVDEHNSFGIKIAKLETRLDALETGQQNG
ncbi:MAG: hypothetical protein FWE40_04800 [Oscillospiraceae bacterium]|jgi:CBS domain containing-hemolysin-like protein|nr:hypothetical protein [Oscillospiraceae bacterium]